MCGAGCGFMVHCGCRRLVRFAQVCVVVCLTLPAGPSESASPGSIVYSNHNELWIMSGDGSGERPIPNTNGLSEPSQADDQTILALGAGVVVRIDQTGKALSPPVATPVSPGSAASTSFAGWSDLHGPADPVISPDGTHFAYWGFGQTLRYDFGCECSLLRLETSFATAIRGDTASPRLRGTAKATPRTQVGLGTPS